MSRHSTCWRSDTQVDPSSRRFLILVSLWRRWFAEWHPSRAKGQRIGNKCSFPSLIVREPSDAKILAVPSHVVARTPSLLVWDSR